MKPTRKTEAGMAAIALGLIVALVPQTGRISILSAQEPVTVEAQASDSLTQNQSLLLKARLALMEKDVLTAEAYIAEADSISCAYKRGSDRPDYVRALIEEFKGADSRAKSEGMTESVRQDLARSYLNQADALRRCRAFTEAESLVSAAQNLGVTSDTESIQRQMDPDSILNRIAEDRVTAESIRKAASAPETVLTGMSAAAQSRVEKVEKATQNARVLFAQGKTDEAEEIARTLIAMEIPENAFADDSPNRLLADIAASRAGSDLVPATSYEGDGSETGIRQVEGLVLTPNAPPQSHGYLYAQEAANALRAGNREAALTNYRDALRYENELDSAMVREITDAIAELTNPINEPAPSVSQTGVNFEQAPQNIQSEIAAYIVKTYQVRNTDPNEAIAMLEQLKAEIEAADINDAVKNNFLYSVAMATADTKKFADVHGPMIALDNHNREVEEQLRQEREERVQIENRLAEDVEKFNQLLEDGKYDEAMILAKKCKDYSRNSVVSIQLVEMARIKKQAAFNDNLKRNRADGILNAFNDVEDASVINVTDDNPLALGKRWDVVKNRRGFETRIDRSEADLEILSKLDTRISLPFDQPMPLATVLDYIRDTMDINIILDEAALAQADITSDTPVETKLNITLKNYLKHILAPYDLTYVVGDEVLKITDKSQRSGEFYTRVYYVGDLTMNIPNFNQVHNPMDMQSSFDRAYNNARRMSGTKSVVDTIPGIPQGNSFAGSTMVSPNILAQIQASGGSVPFTGGAGGGNDPDELVSLITSVVDPDSWDTVGEPQYFSLNSSLIVRQNEENHKDIKDLLEKLRSMMDMQIAIEVRYIAISDEYYEQIGVNFGATFKTNAPSTNEGGGLVPDGKGIYGITTAATGTGKPFTESLNIDFSQNSYGMAVPQFGNYDPSVGAQLGFAILSDIDTYFFMSASEADRRTNVMQAPKVMMFNGQTAQVTDQTQVPYVYTVIPVVGDFAVARQPVTTVINEGQFMTVQASVLSDRRHVRMTLVPFFSTIVDRDRTFKFDGSESTVSNSTSSSKGSEEVASVSDERDSSSTSEIISTGTTIQQPVVSSFSVSTTVQVPDGGTVLMGGIKRLSEGRSEAGLPILSKIPYIKRLFSNTSIGRETTSLMMMVTPRIVIQEEEERYLTGLTPDDFSSGESGDAFKLK
ncbi:MAG: type II secretion system protein GspD [Thermoguttaceae bacterium]